MDGQWCRECRDHPKGRNPWSGCVTSADCRREARLIADRRQKVRHGDGKDVRDQASLSGPWSGSKHQEVICRLPRCTAESNWSAHR